MITRDSQMEDLMALPGLIAWCVHHGVSPFSCYGAFPGTLGRLLELKGIQDVDHFIEVMNVELPEDRPEQP